MKQVFILISLFLFIGLNYAQNNSKTESHSTAQNAIVKIDGSQNSWPKGDNDNSTGSSSQTSGTENVSFNATSEGIFVTILSGTNKIKLFALTGQLLLNGDLKQGTFFIPTRNGIYFLRVNNKSFKVICK
jgi:hypothetical protein